MRRIENVRAPFDVERLESRVFLSASPQAAALLATSADPGIVAQAASPTISLQQSLLANLGSVTPVTASTVPENGDVNPYGAAFVPAKFPSGGAIHPGDLLVSNFNNSDGLQGTGTTIVRMAPDGTTSTFFQGDAGLGLTTALGTLKKGFVVVGQYAHHRWHQRYRTAGVAYRAGQERYRGHQHYRSISQRPMGSCHQGQRFLRQHLRVQCA